MLAHRDHQTYCAFKPRAIKALQSLDMLQKHCCQNICVHAQYIAQVTHDVTTARCLQLTQAIAYLRKAEQFPAFFTM